jgi:hypothetical protein
MTVRENCAVAERHAGAIAIGEANDAEREEYRKHVATCEACLRDLGGEREIERVIASVSRARDDERWQPDLRAPLSRRSVPRRAWAWAGILAAVVVLALAWRSTQLVHSAPVHAVSALQSRALAELGTQTPPRREGRAESLVVGSPMLTTSFNVSVDSRGTPVRCTVVKSSGHRALDESICRAVLHAHSP